MLEIYGAVLSLPLAATLALSVEMMHFKHACVHVCFCVCVCVCVCVSVHAFVCMSKRAYACERYTTRKLLISSFLGLSSGQFWKTCNARKPKKKNHLQSTASISTCFINKCGPVRVLCLFLFAVIHLYRT